MESSGETISSYSQSGKEAGDLLDVSCCMPINTWIREYIRTRLSPGSRGRRASRLDLFEGGGGVFGG